MTDARRAEEIQDSVFAERWRREKAYLRGTHAQQQTCFPGSASSARNPVEAGRKLFPRRHLDRSWIGQRRCFGVAEIVLEQIRALLAEFPEEIFNLPQSLFGKWRMILR